MNLNRLSIRTILAGAIFVIGNLAVVLVYVSGEVFQRSALLHEKELVKQTIAKDVRQLRREIDREAQSIFSALVSGEIFTKAIDGRKREEVAAYLEQGIDAYIQSNSSGAVKKIFVYGPALEFIAQSPQSYDRNLLIPGMCPRLRERALRAASDGKASPVHGVCYSNKEYFFVSVIPLDTFALKGFVEIIALPEQYFSVQESQLGVPIQVVGEGGETIYRSETWPTILDDGSHLVVSTKLGLPFDGNQIIVQAIHNVEMLHSDLSRISYIVLVLAAVVTLLVIVVSVKVLQKTAVDPITELTYQVGKIRNDQTQLGERVVAEGNAEVYELAQGFNEMTAKLKESYDSMERMAFMDALTKLPNRTLFMTDLSKPFWRHDDQKDLLRYSSWILIDSRRLMTLSVITSVTCYYRRWVCGWLSNYAKAIPSPDWVAMNLPCYCNRLISHLQHRRHQLYWKVCVNHLRWTVIGSISAPVLE